MRLLVSFGGLLLLSLLVDGHSAKEVGKREKSAKEESGDLVKKMAGDTDAVDQRREERKPSRRKSNVKGRRGKASIKGKSKNMKRNEKRKSKNKAKRKPGKKYGKKGAKRRSKKRGKERKRKWRITQRRKKQRKRGKAREDQREASCISKTCLNKAKSSMELMKKVVHFERKVKLIRRKRSVGKKKASKSSIFKSALTHLKELSGGNLSNPVCSGSSDNIGAQQITNLSLTLAKCEESINALCDPSNMPKVNFTFIDSCNKSMNIFKTFVDKCSVLPDEAKACSCWSKDTNSTEMKVAAVRKCDLGDLPKRTVSALEECKSTFGKCKKYQDDVATTLFACSQDLDVLKQKLKNLFHNKKAVRQVQTKISSLMKGSSRTKRRTDASTATGFINLCHEVTSMVDNTPNARQISIYSTLILASNPTDFTSDHFASLHTITAKLTLAIAVLDQEIAVAVSTILGIWI